MPPLNPPLSATITYSQHTEQSTQLKEQKIVWYYPSDIIMGPQGVDNREYTSIIRPAGLQYFYLKCLDM